jgi:hypothetical protein
VTVHDTTAPAITCPADIEVQQDDPTDPSFTGTATATDARDPNPAISYFDDTSKGPDLILRVWSADDGCQTSSCTQMITIADPEEPHYDIRPGACPNVIEVNQSGAAIVTLPTSLLGNDFDVTQVDIASMSLGRSLSLAGDPSVPVFEWTFVDLGTPFAGEKCECNTLGPDGILDLTMHFLKQEVVSVLALDQEPDGAIVELELSGLLLDGRSFAARDCVTISNH